MGSPMCAHYENIRDPRIIREHFKAEPLHADVAAEVRHDVWPGYMGTFIIRPPEADWGDEAVAPRIALPGIFGLLPHWAKDDKLARHTYNARSETVAEKPSFRDAWRKARHCASRCDGVSASGSPPSAPPCAVASKRASPGEPHSYTQASLYRSASAKAVRRPVCINRRVPKPPQSGLW